MPPPDSPPPGKPASSTRGTRATPFWLLVLAGMLLAARIGFGVFERARPSGDAPHRIAWNETQDRIAWIAPEEGPGEAIRSGRPILYDFTAEWCPPCRKMQAEVFADRKSAGVIEKNFVPVRVLDRAREDGANPPVVDELQRRFNVTAFPTLVVASPAGGEPVVIEGYGGKEKTMDALDSARRKFPAGTSRPRTP